MERWRDDFMTQANEEKHYFHINRLLPYSPHQLLKEGDVADVGGESNPFFRFYETCKRTYPVTVEGGEIVQVPGVKFLGAVKRGEVNCHNLANVAAELSTHFAGLVGELIWEDVRKREFPHLPSRQRCVWLIPDLAGVKYWVARLGAASGTFQVLRVRCQGRIHIASEEFLLGDSIPLEEAISQARRYWLGVITNANTEEVIFEGRIIIQEVLAPEQYETAQSEQIGQPIDIDKGK